MKLSTFVLNVRDRLPAGLVGGGLLFASTTIINAGNYAFNLILGRWLGPSAFADASLIITLFLVITFVAVALQMAAAKFAADYTAGEHLAHAAALRRWLARSAWVGGLVILAVFGFGAPVWQHFFQTDSAWPFVVFALGVPFYFVQAVDRGMIQGQTRFGALALSYQAEMWARLIIAIALVALGWSVLGAATGLTLSLVVAWLVARWFVRGLPAADLLSAPERTRVLRFAGPVVAALTGQILINNSDVLLVKHFFNPDTAGLYAALALIGRIVFFATWSVVMVLFPIVARRHQRGEPHRSLLYSGLGVVAAISAVIVTATLFMPEPIITLLFGTAYLSVAPLLGLYAVATALYALANVIISYRLSLENGGGSQLALLAGLLQVLGIWLWHADLGQVVLVQVYVMAALFGGLLIWDSWLIVRKRQVVATKLSSDEAVRVEV